MNSENNIDNKKKFISIFHNTFTAWIILFISLTLTIVAYQISSNNVKHRLKDHFEFRANEIEHAIAERLRIYEQQLWNGVGMIYATDNMNRKKFKKFVDTMDLENHWPGIQGYGYSKQVKPKNKTAHIESIREEGFPEFTIKPEGKRDLYSSIIYLEPFDWRNKRAFGYDMWSNEVRREAMKRSRDEGVAATSGVITLVQETKEDVQRGFLTYVPVYKTKNIPETLDARKEQFDGWVYAAFRANDLMKGILGSEDPNIEFEIFDGKSINKESLLYDSNKTIHLNEVDHNPDFSKSVQVINQGRTWTLYFNTPQNFLSSTDRTQPRFVAIAGGIIDALLFYVIWSFYFINKKAETIAEEMTKEIKDSKDQLNAILKQTANANDELEKKVQERTAELEKVRKSLEVEIKKQTEELEEKVETLERTNNLMIGREEKMIELKKHIAELEAKLKEQES